MKKKVIVLIFCLMILINIFSNTYATIEEDKINSSNVGVYNLDNMELLYGQNQNEKISIASITKVMTAIVAIENISDVNEKVIIDYDTILGKVDLDLVVAGIYDNEELTYYDLIATMLIPSGADSATYLACNLFENEDKFIQKMNEKAKEIGMDNTSFSNSTGLDDENNYSTINDVAKMMKYALNISVLKEIMSLDSYTTSDGSITVNNTISKTCKRFGIEKEYIIGGKTGTTEDAGLCLASFSSDEGVNILTIVTGSSMYSTKPYNIIDSEYLYSEIINNYSMKKIISNGDVVYQLPSTCTKQDNVLIYSKEDILAYTDFVDESKIVINYEGLEMLDYTIKKGEKVGEISIYYNNKLVNKIDATVDEELKFSIVKWAKMNKEPIIILCIILVIIVIAIRALTKENNRKK